MLRYALPPLYFLSLCSVTKISYFKNTDVAARDTLCIYKRRKSQKSHTSHRTVTNPDHSKINDVVFWLKFAFQVCPTQEGVGISSHHVKLCLFLIHCVLGNSSFFNILSGLIFKFNENNKKGSFLTTSLMECYGHDLDGGGSWRRNLHPNAQHHTARLKQRDSNNEDITD